MIKQGEEKHIENSCDGACKLTPSVIQLVMINLLPGNIP
jgi:hypothetical protein